MGVMLTTALVLAAGTVALELIVISKVPALRRFATKFSWASVSISLAFVFLLGMIFGAAGLVAMIAGVIAIVATQPVYWTIKWWSKPRERSERNEGRSSRPSEDQTPPRFSKTLNSPPPPPSGDYQWLADTAAKTSRSVHNQVARAKRALRRKSTQGVTS